MEGTVRPGSGPPGGAESVRALPGPALRSRVLGYHGYRLPPGISRRRLEIPAGVVTVLIGLAGELRLRGDEAHPDTGSFVSGMRTTATRGEHAGGLQGIEVTLSPLGAYQLFGVPMRHLASSFTDLSDLLGPGTADLVDHMRETGAWTERFRLLDTLFTLRGEQGGTVSPEVRAAAGMLWRDPQPHALSRVCREIGWSPRRLRDRFALQIGLSPKEITRVARLQRALRLQISGMESARVAARGGFYDQAHYIRECRAMTGLTPSQFVLGRDRMPPGSHLDRVPGRITSLLLPGD